jgi:hypothetical protein
MMTTNKSKVIITSIFILIFFGGSIVHIQEASAEMKKISGTSTLLKELLNDSKYHNQANVRFTQALEMFSSADPDWDKAKIITAYYYVNPKGEEDNYNGSFVITHHTGDQTFIRYEGEWKWALPKDRINWTAETRGYFTGGTGKFEGIIGTITVKLRGGSSPRSANWEVEYEINRTTISTDELEALIKGATRVGNYSGGTYYITFQDDGNYCLRLDSKETDCTEKGPWWFEGNSVCRKSVRSGEYCWNVTKLADNQFRSEITRVEGSNNEVGQTGEFWME